MKLHLLAASLVLVISTGCSPSGEGSSGEQVGKFTILGTKTDGADETAAKKNAENTLLRFPEVGALVGLWGYNTPQCLEAVRDAGKLGQVKLFGFDEDDATLQGITDGHIAGTVVQQPFEFGYQSMRYLNMIAEGIEFEVPENKIIDIPAKTVTQANVGPFWKNLKTLATSEAPDLPGGKTFAFITNNPSTFWSYARAGCAKAEKEFGITCDFQSPHDGTPAAQNRIMENIERKGGYSGVAVTPLQAANQTELLNRLAAKMPLVCHDSDAPESERRFYLGTNNYEAGKLLGKLIVEQMPEGGEIMIFVGNIDAQNASERRRGMLEVLAATAE